MTLHREGYTSTMIKIELRERRTPEERNGEERRGTGTKRQAEEPERKRERDGRRCNLQTVRDGRNGRTNGRRWDWVMTAFAPGGRLWTRRSGYSSYSLFLRLRGPAVETVGHASPSVHFGPASSSASFHGHTTITAHHDPTFKPSSAGNVDSTHQPLCSPRCQP